MNNAGVDTVVLTPHFYPNRHNVGTFVANVSTAAEELAAECPDRPDLYMGAEVLYCEGIEEMEDLELLCIKGTNTLLLELPMSDEWNRGMIYEIKRMCEKYNVVLAHIDRYADIHGEELTALVSAGAMTQINVSALYSRSAMKAIEPFLASGNIHAIGSDLHGKDKKVYRRFAQAQKKLGGEYFEIMARASKLLLGAEKL